MRKYLLLESMAMIILIISGGCSTGDEYRCESNDLCSSTTEWQYYSCSNDTGHCEKVYLLAIDPLTLPDATIGQSDYQVELTASGGISPYTWSLARGDEEKLKWLTITPEGDDKAILHNSTGTNNEPLIPTETNDGIPLTITLVDSSKHGTAVREDNQGKAFSMTIKINDCPHKCKRINDTEDNPTANENDTQCIIDPQCNCAKQYVCTYYPPTPNACVKWEEDMNCDSKCNTSGTNCCVDECAPLDYPKCVPSQDVGGKATFSTCGYDLIKNDGCFYKTESLCDSNVCKDQQCGECSDLSNICDQQGASICADNINQQICTKQGSCLVWSSPMLCDSFKTCQDGNCKYVVGTHGAGGGKIYYINPNYDPNCAPDQNSYRCNWQYLEAAPTDQSSSVIWGPLNNTVLTSDTLGGGTYNTLWITSFIDDTTIAAWLCRNYNNNGMTDWYLPSKNELIEMYNKKDFINNISNSQYWSSTQVWQSSSPNTYSFSYYVDFNKSSNSTSYDYNSVPKYVRCVRGEPKLW